MEHARERRRRRSRSLSRSQSPSDTDEKRSWRSEGDRGRYEKRAWRSEGDRELNHSHVQDTKSTTDRHLGGGYVKAGLEPRAEKKSANSSVELETDPARLAARRKAIDYGRNTIGYDNYIKAVPKGRRGPEHPRTPDPRIKRSKRAFDGLVRVWRKQLHKWDTGITDAVSRSDDVTCTSQGPLATTAAEEIDDLDALIAEIDAETHSDPSNDNASPKVLPSSEADQDLEMEALMTDRNKSSRS